MFNRKCYHSEGQLAVRAPSGHTGQPVVPHRELDLKGNDPTLSSVNVALGYS